VQPQLEQALEVAGITIAMTAQVSAKKRFINDIPVERNGAILALRPRARVRQTDARGDVSRMAPRLREGFRPEWQDGLRSARWSAQTTFRTRRSSKREFIN
jgi:hypothetical protein